MSYYQSQSTSPLYYKSLKQTRCNPQSSTNIPHPHNRSHVKLLKRSQSSSSLLKSSKNNQSSQLLLIQQRYKQLQVNYRSILQETKNKAILFAKQKNQLQKLQTESIKDKKQIQRLRMMLGFIKKQDFAIQVDLKNDPIQNKSKDFSNTSAYSKADQSTDAGLQQTKQTWKTFDRKRCSQQNSRVKTPYKLLNNKSQTTICFRSPLKQSNIKLPNSKYKFIPKLSFN